MGLGSEAIGELGKRVELSLAALRVGSVHRSATVVRRVRRSPAKPEAWDHVSEGGDETG